MANTFFQVRSFLSYWLDAVDEHSLHSPFFFDLYKHVVLPGSKSKGIARFENLRSKLLTDSRTITTIDYGTGLKNASLKISSVAATSLSTLSYSSIYQRLISHFKCKTILELGTSFGINTLYLAESQGTTVTTFEGSPSIAEIAQLTFQFAEAKNIRLVQGNLDTTLAEYLLSTRKVDFVFMDANHRYQATLNYFQQVVRRMKENGIVVLDDIHYSSEMERAWREIKNHELVYASADLYRCGILFFDPSLNKQHVILQV